MTCENEKKYNVQMLGIMGLYVLTTLVSAEVLDNYDVEGFKTVIALSPMVPLIGAWFLIRHYTLEMDELQRKIQFDAVVFSASLTGLITGAWGFLEGVDYPKLETFWVLPMLLVFWAIGGILARKRYQ